MAAMTESKDSNVGVNIVKGETLDGERALYNLRGALVDGCRFAGPADGESALKECRDVTVRGSDFELRYPLWHARGFSIESCRMTDTCRAPVWYAVDGTLSDSDISGVKCLRECEDVTVRDCRIDSTEFGWKCRGIRIENTALTSEYAFLDSSDIDITGMRMGGKYSFQYTRDVRIADSELDTKDAFWHSRNVTVVDSDLRGEYLGWYSENLTLIGCRISGTQPLCYCRNLRLIDCTMEGTDLAFEYSDVHAEVKGSIESVKNPRSGRIHAGSIGEVVLGDQVMECSCEIVTDE